ncbi:MAG: hypothetical protein JST51_06880 [Armatimonadetes bacterium]|nr:hypothetical protein [Armatimonadota bacterium]
MTNAIPVRAEALVASTSITDQQWSLVQSAVRPELVTPYFNRTQLALAAGLPDAAINYVWNVLEEDLRQRVMSYGIDYFASAIGRPNLRSIDDLREDVKSIDLLDGCFALGIIGDEALFHLQHCRELRNKFSAAHYPLSIPDPLETANFIKNCVKYALCHDLPSAGFSIKEYIDHLDNADADLAESEEFLRSQSSRIHGPLLNRLFDEWMKPEISNELRKAIRVIAPKLWGLTSESVRTSVAMRYASIRERPKPNDADSAREFLVLVKGLTYVPEGLQAAIFKRFAQNLLDAYEGPGNYYTEPAQARALAELGNAVPTQAAPLYMKSITLSFVGNFYGHAWNAEPHTRQCFLGATNISMSALQNILATDATVASILTSSKPAKRFAILADLIKNKAIDPSSKEFLEYCSKGEQNVRQGMSNALTNMAKSR